MWICGIALESFEKPRSGVEAKESMAIGAHPEIARAILANRYDVGSFSGAGEVKRIVSLCFAVDTMKGFVSADPEDSVMILVNCANKRFIPVGRTTKIVAKSLEWQGPRCKTCESKAAQTNPNDSLPIFIHLADGVLGQALRISKVIAVADESPMVPVKLKQARTVR
jgi:hypothetical protein